MVVGKERFYFLPMAFFERGGVTGERPTLPYESALTMTKERRECVSRDVADKAAGERERQDEHLGFFSAGLRIWNEQSKVSSTLIIAPALSNSPQLQDRPGQGENYQRVVLGKPSS
jgi:hypothetical protein